MEKRKIQLMNGSKIKKTAMQNKNVTLRDLKTVLYLICILLKLLLSYHFLQSCKIRFHIIKSLIKASSIRTEMSFAIFLTESNRFDKIG